MKWLNAAIFAIAVSVAVAAPPHFPVTPQPPTPTPVPVPSNVITNVANGEWYVIGSDIEYVWKTVPIGVVAVLQKPSGTTFAGKFAGGTATDEERTYSDKFVYQVKALANGAVTLIGTPKGVAVASDADILVQTLTVGNSPSPQPSPIADPLTASVQTAYTADPSTTKAADKTALAAVYVAVANVANSISIKTSADLFAVLHNSTNARIDVRLDGVRKVIGAEFAKFVSSDSTAILTSQNKADIVTQLTRYSTILNEVK
jgi:hypothetical protein